MQSDESIQREYYAKTAGAYDEHHTSGRDEHHLALEYLSGCIRYFDVGSVLDVGSGTGRAVLHLKTRHPGLRVLGVEPVRELREAGFARGLTEADLVEGDGNRLPFPDDSFDVTCAFGVLHHVRDPKHVVREMLRVSRKGVFISDANNFGQGRPVVRAAKQLLDALGLWRLANLVQTRGKGYFISEGDGLYYSFSVFKILPVLQEKFPRVHFMNTLPAGSNLYRTASHVAVFGARP
jgi:SAM-dependent methyltransferase